MKAEQIVALRPVDGSSAEIQAALDRATEARASVAASYEALQAERPRLLLEGTAKELVANDNAIVQARASGETIDTLIATMAPLLPEAIRQEKIAGLQAELVELSAQEHTDAFVSFWLNEYPVHAKAIAAGLSLEREANRAYHRAREIGSQLEKLGAPSPDTPQSPEIQAIGHVLDGGRSLGSLVRLPGLRGAPSVPTKIWVEDVERVRVVTDYDHPISKRHAQSPDYGKIWPTKAVVYTEQVTRGGPVCEDQPIWPPKAEV